MITMRKNLSIIIPVFNEGKNIGSKIKELIAQVRSSWLLHDDVEIIVVDDGSIDTTKAVLMGLEKNLPATVGTKVEFRYTGYFLNRGKGHAIRWGLGQARYNWKLILDADLSVDFENFYNTLVKVHKLLERNPKRPILVIGRRKQVVRQPTHRIFLGWVFRQLVRGITKLPYRDTQCPYKFLVNLPYNDYIQDLKIDRFAFDVEMIKRFRQKKVTVLQQTVPYRNELNSRVTLRSMIEMFNDIMFRI